MPYIFNSSLISSLVSFKCSPMWYNSFDAIDHEVYNNLISCIKMGFITWKQLEYVPSW